MSAALDLYAKLTETSDDKKRARLIVDAFITCSMQHSCTGSI